MSDTSQSKFDLNKAIEAILDTLDKERERDVISRRFGLSGSKETLEQIGETYGITRERVRQLEKSIIFKLQNAAETDLPYIDEFQTELFDYLKAHGNITTMKQLAGYFGKKGDASDKLKVSFLTSLLPDLIILDDSDDHHHSVAHPEHEKLPEIKARINHVVKTVNDNKKPMTIEEIHTSMSSHAKEHVESLVQSSKKLTSFKDTWGNVKWPSVNPKNIRDKIYLVLKENKKPMHFTAITEAVSQADFKKKQVTNQAIHNELIKDDRFVLIGRGIYALEEWGYKKGNVTDIIKEVLIDAGEPLNRDEIVRRVLRSRQVKATTILLNLQSQPYFERVERGVFTYNPEKDPEAKK
jgi:predicted Zn-ribbon and HTH transcriptional regulator